LCHLGGGTNVHCAIMKFFQLSALVVVTSTSPFPVDVVQKCGSEFTRHSFKYCFSIVLTLQSRELKSTSIFLLTRLYTFA